MRANFDPKEAYVPKAGFIEGWAEIIAAKSMVAQWQPNKTTGDQLPPCTEIVLTLKRLEQDGSPSGLDDEEKELVIEWGAKDGSMLRVQPAIASGPGDDNPEDQGTALGTEGNTLSVPEDYKFLSTAPFMVLVHSLVECGFKRDVPAISSAYLPDLVGTIAHFVTRPAKGGKVNNKTGKPFEDFVVDKITRFPYEKAAQTAQAAKKGGRPPKTQTQEQVAAPPVNGSPSPATTAATAPTAPNGADVGNVGVDTDNQAAIEAVKAAKTALKVNGGETILMAKLLVEATRQAVMLKRNPPAVIAKLRQPNWWLDNAVEIASTPVPVGPQGESGDYVMFG